MNPSDGYSRSGTACAVRERRYELDLLRIVAIALVVGLHLSSQAVESSAPGTAVHAVCSTVSVFCSVCINLFILLSSYFLCKSRFSFVHWFRLWFEVMVYGFVLVTFITLRLFSPFGGDPSAIPYHPFWESFAALFPLSSSQYWFFNVYTVFFFLSPFLAKLVRALTRKQHFLLVLVFLWFGSFGTELAQWFAKDAFRFGMGYRVLWFIALFFCGSYLRFYGSDEPSRKKFFAGLGGYLLSMSCLSLWTLWFEAHSFHPFGYPVTDTHLHYNQPFTVIGSFCLFYAFVHLSIRNAALQNVIRWGARHSFAVYLIHSNFYFSMYYIAAFSPLQNIQDRSVPAVLAMLAAYWLVVLLGCMLVDTCRTAVFRLLRVDRLVDRCGEWIYRMLSAAADSLFALSQRTETHEV